MIQYRILSLDGGGSWALLQAMNLGHIFGEDLPGREILARFDTVVANSGGSIVAAALAADFSPKEILAFFVNDDARKSMFAPASFNLLNNMVALLGLNYKYSSCRKLNTLKNKLNPDGNLPLTDLGKKLGKTELTILGYDYDTQRGKFFRTGNRSGTSSHLPDKTTMAEAVHASTNAPILYFDKPASFQNRRYWDGAVAGFNNPVLVGVTEALAQGIAANEIAVLSLGTGKNSLPVRGRADGNGPDFLMLDPMPKKGFHLLADDIQKLAKSVTSEPPEWSTYSAYIATGHKPMDLPDKPRFFRLNPLIQPDAEADEKLGQRWKVPSCFSEQDFRKLLLLDMDAVDKGDVKLIYQLGEKYIQGLVPNQGIQTDPNLKVTLGYNRFSPVLRGQILDAFS
jgi:predicted acylesterase/phospholipase RssA